MGGKKGFGLLGRVCRKDSLVRDKIRCVTW